MKKLLENGICFIQIKLEKFGFSLAIKKIDTYDFRVIFS